MPTADIELIKGGRGDFIVTVDGDELWNKRQMGDQFPDEPALVEKIRSRTS